MSAYGTKSKTTKILAEFRHARFFQDDDVKHLYEDLEVVAPKYDKDKTLLNPEQAGKPKNLKQYEGTDRDAFIAFKRTKIGSDDEGIRGLLYYEDLIDRRAHRKAVAELAAQGEPSDEADEMYLKDAERTDLPYAKAEYFTRKVVGAFFAMPDDMQNKDVYGDPKDPNKQDVYGPEDNVPPSIKPNDTYEYAGKIPPISFEMFEVLDVSVLIEYLTYMDEIHGGRSPVQEAQFPAGDVPADDGPPVPDGRRSKGKKPA